MNRTIVSVVLFLILSLVVVADVKIVEAEPQTIVVPDNYPLIQDAIDAANVGDTIFVKSGVYYELLEINKTLTLIGEDREHTIIDAHKITTDVVHITANDVTLANFTLGHTGYIFSSGGTPPSGVCTEGYGTKVINCAIVSVEGPAFQIMFDSGSFILQNNIVSDSIFRLYDIMFYYNLSESEAVEIVDMPSPFPPDISVLEGNEVLELTRTKGASLGDLVLKDNATLIVDDFDAKAQSLEATNNSRIILRNSALLYVHKITGATPRRIYLMDNASLNSTDSETVRIVCRNDTQVWARNSTLQIEAFGNALVELNNCTSRLEYASDNAEVTVTDSYFPIYEMSGEAQVWVSNSNVPMPSPQTIEGKSKLWVINSTLSSGAILRDETNVWIINSTVSRGCYFKYYDNSNLWVVNSTWNRANTLRLYNQSSMWFINNVMTENEAINIYFKSAEAKISYCWYLSVNVKSPEGTALENMKVEVYHTNGTLVDEGTTDENGNAQFLLERHIWKNSTHEYFVLYNIKAYNTDFEGKKDIELDYLSEEITLTVNLKEPSQTEPEPTETEPTETEPTETEPTESEPTGQDYEFLLTASIVIIAVAVAISLLVIFRKKRQK